MLTQTQKMKLAELIQDIATGGPLHSAKIGLYVNNYNIVPGSLLTDLTQASFTGSTPVVCTFGTPYVTAAGAVESVGAVATFACTVAPGTPEVVYGYFITDGSTTLLGGDRLVTPITISAIGDTINLVPVWSSGAVQV